MSSLRFETTLCHSLLDGGETETRLVILYTVEPGHPASEQDPGAGEMIEIQSVRGFNECGVERRLPPWLTDWIERDEALSRSLLDHSDDVRARRREEAADSRREDRLMLARAT